MSFLMYIDIKCYYDMSSDLNDYYVRNCFGMSMGYFTFDWLFIYEVYHGE